MNLIIFNNFFYNKNFYNAIFSIVFNVNVRYPSV